MRLEIDLNEHMPTKDMGYLGLPKFKMPPSGDPLEARLVALSVWLHSLNAEMRRKVVASVEEDPRAQELVGKHLVWGACSEQFNFENLAMWYLWVVNELGKERADEALERFLALESTTLSMHQAVKGIRVANEVRLTQGNSLIPASHLPEGDFKCRTNWRGLPPIFGVSDHGPDAVITTQVERPKAIRPEEPRRPDPVWQEMFDLALLLNALPNVTCIPVEASATVAPTVPYGPFGGNGWGRPLHSRPADVTSTELHDVTGLEELWNHFQRGTDKRKERWRNALMRLAYAKATCKPDDLALELGIALEMLLLEGENTDQLKLMFRLRGAWLIAPDATEERAGAFKLLGEIYDWRCDVAHTGALKKRNADSLSVERERATRLGERIAMAVVRAGEVDWEAKILNLGGLP